MMEQVVEPVEALTDWAQDSGSNGAGEDEPLQVGPVGYVRFIVIRFRQKIGEALKATEYRAHLVEDGAMTTSRVVVNGG
jgi:hypothetical protein